MRTMTFQSTLFQLQTDQEALLVLANTIKKHASPLFSQMLWYPYSVFEEIGTTLA